VSEWNEGGNSSKRGMGSSRTVVALALLGLEHSVLEHIPGLMEMFIHHEGRYTKYNAR